MKRTITLSDHPPAPSWHVVDLSGQVLGRIATDIATLLIGKGKIGYSSNLDYGDYVVATNASLVVLTGKKRVQKMYRWHTNFPQGFRERPFTSLLEEHPDRIVIHAVSRMLPKNKLRAQRLRRLKVFPGVEHPYQDRVRKSA